MYPIEVCVFFAAQISKEFKDAFESMSLGYDYFIRTSDESHKEQVWAYPHRHLHDSIYIHSLVKKQALEIQQPMLLAHGRLLQQSLGDRISRIYTSWFDKRPLLPLLPLLLHHCFA